jgi:hypothetical protein
MFSEGETSMLLFSNIVAFSTFPPADLHGLATLRARRDPHDGDAPMSRINNVDPVFDASQWLNRKASAQALKGAEARKTSGRRRMVDPATCERDYSPEEIEFMQAIQAYKLSSGRMFPTWSEVLEVLGGLGYEKA